MKISKNLLQKIVLEELQYVVSEQDDKPWYVGQPGEETETRKFVKGLMPAGMSKDMRNWAMIAIEVADVTGVTAWEEAVQGIYRLATEPSLENLGWAALSAIAAVPLIGKVTKPAQLTQLANSTTAASRILRTSGDDAATVLAGKLDNMVASLDTALPAVGRVDPRVAQQFSRQVREAGEELLALAPGSSQLAARIARLSDKVTGVGFKGWRRAAMVGAANVGKSASEFAGADTSWSYTNPLSGDTVKNMLGSFGSEDQDDVGSAVSGLPTVQPRAPAGTPTPSRRVPAVTPRIQPPPVDRGPVCNNRNILHDAYEMYDALKGWDVTGAGGEAARKIVKRNSEPECLATLYRAYEEVLRREDDTDDGDLIDWLRDDGEDASAMKVKKGMISWSRSLKSKKRKKK